MGGKIDAVEAANKIWQAWIGRAVDYMLIAYNEVKTVGTSTVTDIPAQFIDETVGILCDVVSENHIYGGALCSVGKELVISTLKDIVTGKVLNPYEILAPTAIKLAFQDIAYLTFANVLDKIATEANNVSIADYFLDEYYKAGSNDAALKVMAKKYGAKNTSLSTLVDALANQKGYYNGFANSLTWSFYGDEYDNEAVVRNIENIQTFNKMTIKNFLKK